MTKYRLTGTATWRERLHTARGCARVTRWEDLCYQDMMRFPQCGRATTKTSHHLNVLQLPRTGGSFADKSSNNAFRPIRDKVEAHTGSFRPTKYVGR
jgi:hypothetical protein